MVIGVGLVGCDTAAMCAQTAEVTVIEPLSKILMSVDHCRKNEQALVDALGAADVRAALQGACRVREAASRKG